MVRLQPIALIAAAFLTWSAATSRAGSQADALIRRTKVECLEAAANDPTYAGHPMAVMSAFYPCVAVSNTLARRSHWHQTRSRCVLAPLFV
jgi:hypothetical protein